MDLPNLLKNLKSQPEDIERFIAIEISPSAIKTAVWYVLGSSTKVETTGSIQSWESDDTQDLIQAIDTSLSAALSGIEPEPNQVIFGLPETWVGETDIATNKKSILKDICKSLGLKPVGFVVTTEAIIHHLHETEGGPPSAILIKIEADQVIVSIIRQGTLEGAQVVGRSTTLSADVEEGIARFSQTDDIPSRMIIYDSKENIEEIKQELISYDWESRLPFLHFPKIESLTKDTSIRAVAIAGGAEVAQSLGLIDDKESAPTKATAAAAASAAAAAVDQPDEKESVSDAADGEEPTPDETESDDQPEDEESPPDLASEFGFTTIEVKAEDDKEDKKDTPADDKPDTPTPTPPKKTQSPKEPPTPKQEELIPVDKKTLEPTQTDEPKDQIKPKKKLALFTGFASIKSKFKKPKIKLSKTGPTKKRLKFPPLLLIGGIILAAIVVLGGIGYWYLPKATVTVYIKPKAINKEVTFELDTTITEPDLENNRIPATVETVTATGTAQTPTTGSKTVGDAATGQVAVYNRTTSEKTLSAGTELKSGSLVFTIDSDVSIASASTSENDDFTVTIQPAKSEVSATAKSIGDQYNLSVDTQFNVANFSSDSFIAKAVTDFTGGSSREIQAVSASDVELLEDDLIKQLRAQTSEELKTKSNSEKGVVFSEEYEVEEEEYSSQIGDEADSVSLTMTITQTAYIYDLKDVSLIAQNALLDEIPDDYTLIAEETNVEVIETQINEDDTATVTSKITLKLMPIIDTQKIGQNIQGKYPPITEGYFKTLPNFVRTETSITPALPARLNTFPRMVENITVEIKTAE